MADRVDAGLAEWLRAQALYATAGGEAPAWGDRALETELISPLAMRADAEAEAARQLAFLAGPLVLDQHVVDGLRADLIGRVVTLEGDTLDYQAGVAGFVVSVQEGEGVTTLGVLRQLV